MELEGKIALVTGAGRRLGKAVALALARAGADVGLHYRASRVEAQETAREIEALGRRAELFQADLADPEQIDRLFEAVASAFGQLDVLVNNAAICERTPIKSLSAEQWDRHFAINTRAAALCISRAVPLMGAARTDRPTPAAQRSDASQSSKSGGVVVNIADVSAGSPWPGYPAYCASKAALLALTRSAAKALAPAIRVNSVSPGAILWSPDTTDVQKRKVLDHIPMGRTGSPEDVAAAVVFLARQDYVTGQDLRVDGGWKTG